MRYVFIGEDCYSFPLASHLIDEGHEVQIAMIESASELGLPDMKDEEDPEHKEERLSNYDGIIKKLTLPEIMKKLAAVTVDELDDYFIFFDHNDSCNIAQECLDMGFTNGLFPTEYYHRMETDRVWAKEFVEENYPDLKIAGYSTFDKVEDGIKAIEESDEILVVKSNGSFGKTVVPKTDDVETEKGILIDTLRKNKKDYEAGGFTLEEKISDALEITPILVFYNGKPIHSIAEFENKQYGCGNIGAQKGGNQCLTIQTDLNCKLNQMAFPPIIYELAKKHPGLGIYDAGLLFDGNDFYFSEFAGMRYGYDGIFAEIAMADNGGPFVNRYFEMLMKGKSPIANKYGASIRLFNYEGSQTDTDDPLPDVPVSWEEEIDDHLWMYHVHKDGKQLVTTSDTDFIGAITAAGDDMEEVIKELHERVDKFHCEKLYYRAQFDFLSTDYRSSIPNRVKALLPFITNENVSRFNLRRRSRSISEESEEGDGSVGGQRVRPLLQEQTVDLD